MKPNRGSKCHTSSQINRKYKETTHEPLVPQGGLRTPTLPSCLLVFLLLIIFDLLTLILNAPFFPGSILVTATDFWIKPVMLALTKGLVSWPLLRTFIYGIHTKLMKILFFHKISVLFRAFSQGLAKKSSPLMQEMFKLLSRRSPEVNGNPFGILVWEIPLTEKPSGLNSEVAKSWSYWRTERAHTHTDTPFLQAWTKLILTPASIEYNVQRLVCWENPTWKKTTILWNLCSTFQNMESNMILSIKFFIKYTLNIEC